MTTRTGTAGHDRLTGSPGEDTLDGLDGDDVLFGLGSIDLLLGGAGHDWLDGGVGNDTLIGGLGDDTYVVEKLYDRTIEFAGEGTDTVIVYINHQMQANIEYALAGNAKGYRITGNELSNRITGGGGVDTLDGAAGADTLSGGLGNDFYIVDRADDLVIETADAGRDTVWSRVDWSLGAAVENLTLLAGALVGVGNALANTLVGNTAGNRLEGRAGDDLLDGGAGADSLIGGLGNDTYVVDWTTDVIVENSGEGTDTVKASTSWTLGADLENLTLVRSALDGTGNTLDNRIIGTAARNTLQGLDGDDWLDGGTGNDTLRGGEGNDTYVVDHSADIVLENAGAGIDTVRSIISYVLAAPLEHLVLTGNAAINGAGNTLANSLSGNIAANTLSGGGGLDVLRGLEGNDVLVVADPGFGSIDGGTGVDILRLAGPGQRIDLTASPDSNRVFAVEIFDLANAGGVLVLDAAQVAARGLPDAGNQMLVVFGGASDAVRLEEADWSFTGTRLDGSTNFDCYTLLTAEVRVQSGIGVEIGVVGLPPI